MSGQMEKGHPVQVGDFVRVHGMEEFWGHYFEGEHGLVLDTDGDVHVKVWVFDDQEAYDFNLAALTLVTREEALA